MQLVRNAFTIAFILTAALAAVRSMVMPQDALQAPVSTDGGHMRHLARLLQTDEATVATLYRQVAKNVRTVLSRQYDNDPKNSDRAGQADRPVCQFLDEDALGQSLRRIGVDKALFTLARVYDEAHITLCHGRGASRGKLHGGFSTTRPQVKLADLAAHLDRDKSVIEDHSIILEPGSEKGSYRAVWKQMPPMSFDNLQRLDSLGGKLPGESAASIHYAGIGGGGGSDIISASLLGRLLRLHGKKMDLLVSTRTWATGSQGIQGSKMGIKRTIWNHGGPVEVDGKAVPGTFRVTEKTSSEGRPLEAIPVPNHDQVFIVLDQGESRTEIDANEQADLKDQLQAVLAQARDQIQTVAIVDTGGDVFGADVGGTSTPDQDLRVQQAICAANHSGYNLVTAVIAPGVDAPDDAPQKAFKSGGRLYKPTDKEKAMLLDVLSREYKMDGSVPGRFGKTTMALQARLRGAKGWTSLDLPEHIVDTWDNPWSSFVYIRECMSDIVLMPTEKLLPLIEPDCATD